MVFWYKKCYKYGDPIRRFDEQATHEGTDWMNCYSKLKPEQQKLGISLSMAIDITSSTDKKEDSTEIKSEETKEIKEKKEAN